MHTHIFIAKHVYMERDMSITFNYVFQLITSGLRFAIKMSLFPLIVKSDLLYIVVKWAFQIYHISKVYNQATDFELFILLYTWKFFHRPLLVIFWIFWQYDFLVILLDFDVVLLLVIIYNKVSQATKIF